MKFIRRKQVKGRTYYHFVVNTAITGKSTRISKYIGDSLQIDDLPNRIAKNLEEVAVLTAANLSEETKKYFLPKSALHIEKNRFWYQGLHSELFFENLHLFRTLFATLFTLNSNKAEGSKVTRKDIEKVISRKQKPKSLMDWEVIDSLEALHFALSKNMKWNLITIKKIHGLLLRHIAPEIAGQYKKVDNVINNQPTTHWKKVRKELTELLAWFAKNRKKLYPPIAALIFHYRFEKIHPFEDGNGRIGRILFNAHLLQQGYMPTIFFSENHTAYCTAIEQAKEGRPQKLAHYFINKTQKTRKAIESYQKEGVLRGGSPLVGRWEIERGKIRKY